MSTLKLNWKLAAWWINAKNRTSSRYIGYWLLGGSGLVCGMVVLGGWTRLTESGLSMVDWKLLHFKAPSSSQEWQDYFDKYKLFPEYKIKNEGMTLDQFKRIYYYEHIHRVLGRITGAYFLLPSIYFTIKGALSGGIARRIWAINALVLSQGIIGWYMVKSGLREEIAEKQLVPRVEATKLTMHLGMAFAIYALALRTGLKIIHTHKNHLPIRLRRMVGLSKGMIFATVLSGGMVAGLDAGLIYDSFPRMGNSFIPTEIGQLRPVWKDLTENPTTVQFVHRYLAKATFLSLLILWIMGRKAQIDWQTARKLNYLLGIGTLQASLGIATLLSNVDIRIASLHQAGSVALFTTSLLI